MNDRTGKRMRRARVAAVMTLTVGGLTACMQLGHMVMPHKAERPAAEAFGFGPRASAAGMYSATLDPVETIRIRRLQTMRLMVSDAAGQPVDGAEITVDGGMPEHGHGLPTRPQVTRNLGGGAYEVGGVKFNMGGWWEMKFVISTPTGADTVTFNLDL